MDGDRCRQPGCTGTIEQGFCNSCGLEPAAQAAAVGPAAAPAPGPADPSAALSGRTGSGSARRGSGTSRSSSRKHLGLGLVTVPQLPQADPELAVLAEPKVPDNRRFCSNPACVDAQGNPT